MMQYALKVLISALMIVAISEIAKRSSTLGAIIASLPLTSLLAFLWLYGETGDTAKIAELSQAVSSGTCCRRSCCSSPCRCCSMRA